MTTKEKKYYILYKVETDADANVIDLKYLYELCNYNDIVNYLKISKHNIKKMINNNINDFNNLKTHKNYCIIKE